MRIQTLVCLLAAAALPSPLFALPAQGPVQVDYFPLPYGLDAQQQGYDCSAAPKPKDLSTPFLACLAGGSLAGKNVGKVMCDCLQAVDKTREKKCEDQTIIQAGLLCQSNKPFCDSWDSWQPIPSIPVELPNEEINFSSLSALRLPLPTSIPAKHVAREVKAYYLGYRAALLLTLLADGALCDHDNDPAYLSNFPPILPSFETLQLLVPVPKGSDSRGQSPSGAVLRKGEDLLIVFRGSQQFYDWAIDVDYATISTPQFPGKTHRGFTTMALAELKLLEPFLDKFLASPQGTSIRRIVVAGHSLGSEVSRLVAYRVTERYATKQREVFGIHVGASRMGDVVFQDTFASKVQGRSLDFELDMVPQIICTTTYGCPAQFKTPYPTDNFQTWHYADTKGTILINKAAGGAYFLLSPPNNVVNMISAHICTYGCFTASLLALSQPTVNPRDACDERTCPVYVDPRDFWERISHHLPAVPPPHWPEYAEVSVGQKVIDAIVLRGFDAVPPMAPAPGHGHSHWSSCDTEDKSKNNGKKMDSKPSDKSVPVVAGKSLSAAASVKDNTLNYGANRAQIIASQATEGTDRRDKQGSSKPGKRDGL